MTNILIIIAVLGVVAYFILGKKRIKEIVGGVLAVAVVSTSSIEDVSDINTSSIGSVVDINTTVVEQNTSIVEQATAPIPTATPTIKPATVATPESVSVLNITPKLKEWHSIKTNDTIFSTVIDKDRVDTVIGLGEIEANGYSDLACIIRFSPNGIIDVRDHDIYRADVRMTYKKGKKYTFRFEVDIKNHTYSVYVKEDNKKYIPIATNYRFREEQNKINKINYVSSCYQISEYSKVINDNLIYDDSYKKGGVPKYVDVELISDEETIITVTDDKGHFKTFVKPNIRYRVVAIENGHRFVQKDLYSKVLTWKPEK